MGWEVKQYGVKDFIRFAATSVITLMTPEPTGGVYQQDGVEKFMRSFGYPDKMGRPNRINFGGRYDTTRDFHSNTGLKLVIHGFDAERRKLENLNGYIALIDRSDKVAASWSVKGIIDHWKRKHGRAVYVPSIHQSDPTAYAFGQIVDMCEGADILNFLNATASGDVYLDPAVKLEGVPGSSPKIKRRNQFRVSHKNLSTLYTKFEKIDVTAGDL